MSLRRLLSLIDCSDTNAELWHIGFLIACYQHGIFAELFGCDCLAEGEGEGRGAASDAKADHEGLTTRESSEAGLEPAVWRSRVKLPRPLSQTQLACRAVST